MSNLQTQSPKFTVALQTKGYQNLINNTLKDPKRANRFIASITSAVSVNQALQECTPSSILSAALLGESLNLSPSPQLGQYYMVPFNDKAKGKVASFILGYKGYLQLAIRSGYYKKINVLALKEGELVSYNPLEEEIEVDLIADEGEREAKNTIGYYAMFEYSNGFKKAMYWSFGKMLAHANRYSPAFNKDVYKLLQDGKIPDKDKWKYSSFWYKDFDAMALKTMLRQLISKWGIMSIEMQDAYSKDEAIISENGDYDYIKEEDITETKQEIKEEAKQIESCEAEIVNMSDLEG